jgi:uncharacterized protein
MLIFWDEPKRLANLARHGFDFTDLDEAFFFRRWSFPCETIGTSRSAE